MATPASISSRLLSSLTLHLTRVLGEERATPNPLKGFLHAWNRPKLMYLLWLSLGLLPLAASCALHAQPQLLSDKDPHRVFPGQARKVSVLWHNPTDQPVTADLTTRLYQASSATAARLDEASWKKLEVLPGQTIIESVTLSFPSVRTETRFLIQWLARTNQVLGVTEVFVYPPNLLNALETLAGDEPVGAFDPQNQLKPLLKAAAVSFIDLEDTGLETFGGKLTIIGPFQSKAQRRAGLATQIKALAKRGVAIVWLQPPPESHAQLKPSFYIVPEGKGAVVVVEAALVADLSANPRAQLNLLQCSRLALHPEPFHLPESNPEP